MYTRSIGVGAGPAGPVLAGPLVRRFNEIHCRHIYNCAHASLALIIATSKSFLRFCVAIVICNHLTYMQLLNADVLLLATAYNSYSLIATIYTVAVMKYFVLISAGN